IPALDASRRRNLLDHRRVAEIWREKEQTRDFIGVMRRVVKRAETAERDARQAHAAVAGGARRKDDVLAQALERGAAEIIAEVHIGGGDVERDAGAAHSVDEAV